MEGPIGRMSPTSLGCDIVQGYLGSLLRFDGTVAISEEKVKVRGGMPPNTERPMRAAFALIIGVVTSGVCRTAAAEPHIVDWPIRFDEERIELTRTYVKRHYGLTGESIDIVPRAIVIHWTGTRALKATWRGFDRVRMRSSRKHLVRGGLLNVSAHFLVARDGTIYRLMPETRMARHCIGLNFDSIGVENVGGGSSGALTRRQLQANAELVRYLIRKYPTIKHLLGHMEWRRFEKTPLFRELDPTYRNAKADPGRRFMGELRRRVSDLGLRDRPE